MRRIPLLCLVAALFIVPAAKAASTNQIIRDCADDGVLEGHYTAAQLRNAERHLPTDVAEYSNCGDLLSRAADAAAAAARGGTSGTPSKPRRAAGSTGGGTSSSAPAAAPTSTPDTTTTGAPVAPSTPQDTQALAAAAKTRTPPAIHLGGRHVVSGLAANVSRNSLPSSLVVVLILLGAAAVAVGAPVVRRVLARRRP